jgi:AmmeMemoRadiSam system protein B
MSAVRPPAVAGRFYPQDPATLRALVASLLGQAGGGDADLPPPQAIIVPHAGYAYSGAVAARAFAAVAPAAGRIRRVVLLGPAHFVWIEGVAAPASVAFGTPLGLVPIDRAALDTIRGLPQVVESDAPHQREHSLEVQLPFLQTVLGDFKLVPLAVGDIGGKALAAILDKLWHGEETLVVVSSDLSHYHDYAEAKELDTETATAIEHCDGARLGPADACGYLPLGALLAVARKRHLSVRRLDLRNSGDTAGPHQRVVGYGAWAVGSA